MSNTKKTKIVATLGPATSKKEVLHNMIKAGVDVFRINFSHADYDAVKERIDMIRSLSEEFGYNTAILADLQGPKLRVGIIGNRATVKINIGDTCQTVRVFDIQDCQLASLRHSVVCQ